MDRSALKDLLTDIDNGSVDLVVVYKVDRLTRSLMDFSKIIETLDARNVSFVSVTQQFNTANSMGRLTLNVLLSFAQFEREVTAERIRDKIAASKKKGMWMGGQVPLGYYAIDKKLVVNDVEANTVRKVFELYQNLKSVPQVVIQAKALGIVTKVRHLKHHKSGGIPFTRGHLYYLLRNPIYVGDVRHKENPYPGQHSPIIDRASWNNVQQLLDQQAPSRHSKTNTGQSCLFTGLIYDETGDRLCPSHAKKGQRRYLYYISKRLTHDPKNTEGVWRLPAKELERTIVHAVKDFLGNERQWIKSMEASSVENLERVRKNSLDLAENLGSSDYSIARQSVQTHFLRITVAPGCISVNLQFGDTEHNIDIPFQTQKRGVESKIIIGGQKNTSTSPDPNLVKVIQRSHAWWSALSEEEGVSIKSIAAKAKIDASDVTRLLPLAFLAPDIVEAILDGRQPIDLNVEKIKKLSPIPADWNDQKLILGILD